MVYVTGDTHGDLGYFLSQEEREMLAERNRKHVFFSPESACRDPGWGKNDKVIVTGDFGFVMYGEEKNPLEGEKLDILAAKPYEILFVDGNHEGFPSLLQYPQEERYGGPVRKLRENIFWLRRGFVYTIEGKTFFTMGGAATPDFDKPNKMAVGKWFPEEIPTRAELDRGRETLMAAGKEVDYILTHTVPSRYLQWLLHRQPRWEDADFDLMDFLEWGVYRQVSFRKWFFGHFHLDREFYDNMVACMNEVHKVP